MSFDTSSGVNVPTSHCIHIMITNNVAERRYM